MPTPAEEPYRRVSLREIAREAGVAIMTVSLSLRDSPKITEPVRKRVCEIAHRLGYRPDAEISRLMSRLRASRTTKYSVSLALVDLVSSAAAEHHYVRRLREGAMMRAEALGYGVNLFRLRDYKGDPKKMMRVIRARGIVGGVLLPADEPTRMPETLWDGFAIVSATTAVTAPRFHCVVPNQLYNTMALIENMHRRGYQKVGAIITESLEQRTAHCYSLAMIWHGHGERILILKDTIAPAERERTVAAWLRDHAVDVILAQHTDLVTRAAGAGNLQGGERPGLVSLSTIQPGDVAYQDELPEYIGESAVSLLVGMMHNNETGVPGHPRVTTVDGAFREGPSVRPLPGELAAPMSRPPQAPAESP